MSRERHAAQDISYAKTAESMPGQTVVKLLENATGHLTLIKRALAKTNLRVAVISGRSL
jgi:hypothetical protein